MSSIAQDKGPDEDNQRIMLGLLQSVERDGGQSQRRLAAELGIALYLKRCIKKGLVKVSEAPARRYAYYLTPHGFAEKSRLAAAHLLVLQSVRWMLKNLLHKLRRSPFDFPVSGGGTIGDIVCAPLDRAGLELAVIDLGARNGMYHVPASYSRRSKLIGFEPNPKEYEKLTRGTTDMNKTGAVAPAFRRTEYHPFAVWRARERRQLYITSAAGGCTLMGESVPAVTERMYLDRSRKQRSVSYAQMTKVIGTESVECVALDEVIADGTIVDFMKMDVEGAELACLQGAAKLLESHRVLLIYTEFVALPYYGVHDVLGAQHLFLNDRGYRLIDLELRHPTYRRGARDLPETADRRMLHAGDAVFVLDPDRVAMEPLLKQRLAAILFVFGFSSYALSLLDETGLTSKADIERIESSVRRTMTTRRLSQMWKQLPAKVMGAFS